MHVHTHTLTASQLLSADLPAHSHTRFGVGQYYYLVGPAEAPCSHRRLLWPSNQTAGKMAERLGNPVRGVWAVGGMRVWYACAVRARVCVHEYAGV